MVRKAAIALVLGTALSLFSPAVATNPPAEGTILVGGFLAHCNGQTLSEVCITKPAGVTGWTLTYSKTSPTNLLGTMDHGSKVMVYGNMGTVAQPFTLSWRH